MKKTTGFYPRLCVDTTGCSAVGQTGGVLLTETVRVSGLGVELSAALGRWRKPTAVHDPAKVVLDLALTLALGGDCLADATTAPRRARCLWSGRLRPDRFKHHRRAGRRRRRGAEGDRHCPGCGRSHRVGVGR